jgi:hypothetical protein
VDSERIELSAVALQKQLASLEHVNPLGLSCRQQLQYVPLLLMRCTAAMAIRAADNTLSYFCINSD